MTTVYTSGDNSGMILFVIIIIIIIIAILIFAYWALVVNQPGEILPITEARYDPVTGSITYTLPPNLSGVYYDVYKTKEELDSKKPSIKNRKIMHPPNTPGGNIPVSDFYAIALRPYKGWAIGEEIIIPRENEASGYASYGSNKYQGNKYTGNSSDLSKKLGACDGNCIDGCNGSCTNKQQVLENYNNVCKRTKGCKGFYVDNKDPRKVIYDTK